MTLIVYILYTDQDLKAGYIHASKRKTILYFPTVNWYVLRSSSSLVYS